MTTSFLNAQPQQQSAHLQWNDPDTGDINFLTFDAVTREGHEATSMVTDHPVETGVAVTDHVRPNPKRIQVEGFISNTPVYGDASFLTAEPLSIPAPPIALNLSNALSAALSALGNSLGLGSSPIVATVFEPSNQDYVAGVYSQLDTLRVQATLVTVLCPNAQYNNMLLEGFEMERDAEVGTGARFTLSLREIRVVSSSVTQAPTPTIPRASQTINSGGQNPQQPTPQKESVLYAATH